MSKELFNAREHLAVVAEWLSYQDESLSFGLVNAYDALRLYDHSHSNPHLGEMADEWLEQDRIAALGYDPLETREAHDGRCVQDTGATKAHAALVAARQLLASVAFVATEGDTESVLALIDEVVHPAVDISQ
ncbi:hypothetical protein LJR129_005041 [Acidovorax sp. LjRoot129]|uniref:hypothetical protein n=1 Tax=unclassified Acidovorax TaxID=2684926 RepID=UPI003ECCF7E1